MLSTSGSQRISGEGHRKDNPKQPQHKKSTGDSALHFEVGESSSDCETTLNRPQTCSLDTLVSAPNEGAPMDHNLKNHPVADNPKRPTAIPTATTEESSPPTMMYIESTTPKLNPLSFPRANRFASVRKNEITSQRNIKYIESLLKSRGESLETLAAQSKLRLEQKLHGRKPGDLLTSFGEVHVNVQEPRDKSSHVTRSEPSRIPPPLVQGQPAWKPMVAAYNPYASMPSVIDDDGDDIVFSKAKNPPLASLPQRGSATEATQPSLNSDATMSGKQRPQTSEPSSDNRSHDDSPKWGGIMFPHHRRDKPRRAYTAYNIYFQIGFGFVLQGRDLLTMTIADVEELDLDLLQHRQTRGEGGYTFRQMALLLSAAYRKIDKRVRECLQARAKADKERYRADMAVFNEDAPSLDDLWNHRPFEIIGSRAPAGMIPFGQLAVVTMDTSDRSNPPSVD